MRRESPRPVTIARSSPAAAISSFDFRVPEVAVSVQEDQSESAHALERKHAADENAAVSAQNYGLVAVAENRDKAVGKQA